MKPTATLEEKKLALIAESKKDNPFFLQIYYLLNVSNVPIFSTLYPNNFIFMEPG